MSIYRNDQVAELRQIEQHLAVAAGLIESYWQLIYTMAAARGEPPALYHDARRVWCDAILQLDEARGLARRLGHSVALFDTARHGVGDVHLLAAGLEPLTREVRMAGHLSFETLRRSVPGLSISPLPLRESTSVVHRTGPRPLLRARVLLALVVGVIEVVRRLLG